MRNHTARYVTLYFFLVLINLIASHSAIAQRLLVSSFHTGEAQRYDVRTKTYQGNFLAGDGLRGPHALIYGPDGNLYIASGDSDEVKRYNGHTGAFMDNFIPAGSGGLHNPVGMVFGPDGNLYVSSPAANRNDIKRYDGHSGAYLGSFASGGGLDTPSGIVFGPDGNLYVCCNGLLFGNQGVKRYNGVTGAYMDTFAIGNGLDRANELLFGPDGNLYVSSYGSNEVKRFNGQTGAFLDNFVPAGSGGLDGPYGMAFGPDGYFYVSCYNTGVVKRYHGHTGAFIDDVAVGNGLDGPTELLFEQNGAHHIPFDLKGNGNTDLLWQNTRIGDTSVWYMDGAFYAGQWDYIARSIPTVWTLSVAADLLNDGNSELIWRNSTTGDVTVWYMNGAFYTGQWDYIAHNVPLQWSLVGVADMNGDGNPDLIWQNTQTGDVSVWYMKNAQWTGNWDYVGRSVPLQWKIVGVTDLNHDGKSDLVWQNTQTGDVTYWLLDGIRTVSTGYIAHNIPTAWKIVGTADFNRDNNTDLLWQNAQTGDVTVWYMSETQWTGNWDYIAHNVPTDWTIVPTF